jgi:hypothetical protein
MLIIALSLQDAAELGATAKVAAEVPQRSRRRDISEIMSRSLTCCGRRIARYRGYHQIFATYHMLELVETVQQSPQGRVTDV